MLEHVSGLRKTGDRVQTGIGAVEHILSRMGGGVDQRQFKLSSPHALHFRDRVAAFNPHTCLIEAFPHEFSQRGSVERILLHNIGALYELRREQSLDPVARDADGGADLPAEEFKLPRGYLGIPPGNRIYFREIRLDGRPVILKEAREIFPAAIGGGKTSR